MQEANVIVDANEPRKMLEKIVDHPQLFPKVESLKSYGAGDYVVGKYVIERKERSDLRSSISDGRLFEQMNLLASIRDTFAVKPLLLIEGSQFSFKMHGNNRRAYYAVRNKYENVLYGTINAITLRLQIPIVYTLSKDKSVDFIASLVSEDDVSDTFGLVRSKGGVQRKSLREKQLFFLEGFVGVGRKKAIKLLDEFGDPLTVVEKVVYESSTVSTVVGSKTVEKMNYLLKGD